MTSIERKNWVSSYNLSASEILSDKRVGLWREWPYKKSLKIPKGQSESVNRRTNNTMAKRKRTNIHTKDRVTWTPLKNGGELGCSGRVSSSCSTSGTCHVNLVTNPVISHEWGKDREVLTTSETHPWSFVTQI